MTDEFVLLLIKTKNLAMLFNFVDLKEVERVDDNYLYPNERDQPVIFTEIYNKCSYGVIEQLVPKLMGKLLDFNHYTEICESEKSVFRLIKHLVAMPTKLMESVCSTSFSKTHGSLRRMEMKKYLDS